MSGLLGATWSGVGELAELLEDGGVRRLLQRAELPVRDARIDYIRFKPGTGAVLACTLQLFGQAEGASTWTAYLRTQSAARSEELCAKQERLRPPHTPLGPSVRLLPGRRSVLFLFPHDVQLRGLRHVADLDKLKRTLEALPAIGGAGWRVRARKSSLQPVRYKPERRFIARAALGLKNDATGATRELELFLRFFPDARGERLARLARILRDEVLGARVPPPCGALLDGRLYVEERAPGVELESLLADDPAAVDPEAIAELLATLHGTGARAAVELEQARLPRLGVLEVLARALAAAESLIDLGGEIGALASACLERVQRLAPARDEERLIHGDAHLHQFLADRSGVRMVDFERVSLGHPLGDLGQWCAHAEQLASPSARRFGAAVVEAYARRVGGLDPRALSFFLAVARMERALLPFRHLEAGWPERCAEVLERTLRALDEDAGTAAGRAPQLRWSALFPSARGVWSARLETAEGERSGLFDPRTRALQVVEPSEDRALPGLAPLLRRGRLVAYRCGRRAVVELGRGATRCFAKVLPPEKLRARLGVVEALEHERARAEAQGVSWPRLLAVDPAAGVLCYEAIDGAELRHRAGAERLLQAARALAVWQALPVVGLEIAPDPRLELGVWIEYVGVEDARHAAQVERLFRALEPALATETRGSARSVLVHGDLHDRNLLCRGEQLVVLDLEGLRSGAPAIDVANFAAHLVLRALEHGRGIAAGRADEELFLAEHARCVGASAPLASPAAVALALLRLSCVHRLRRASMAQSATLLEEAARRS